MSDLLHIDATPQKRMFLSIIADYDLNTAVCEIIDNSIDHWIDGGRENSLKIDIRVNLDRQTVVVSDNAGGVKKEDLQLLVAPGASREKIQEGLIGNFGVGGKRAGIALGELVEIKTRHKKSKTYEFELSDKWLRQNDWNVDVYECENISAGTTIVRISKMRQGFDQSAVTNLRAHISETYCKFISERCRIEYNGDSVSPVFFDKWAFPPDYLPSRHVGEISPFGEKSTTVKVAITGGLTYDRDPADRNYGVYFFCNDRLVLAHDKSHHVGFLQKFAGIPHPDASLCRVIVEIRGMPDQMPWNSSKSGINWSHPVYLEIRKEIFALATRYSKISRRLKNDREGEVYAYKAGSLIEMKLQPGLTGKEIVALPVPRGRRKNYSERIVDQNENIFKRKPWVRGLVEAVGIAEMIFRRKSSTKNRVALIVIDSTLEISLKEYLVHHDKKYYSDAQIAELFKTRDKVLREIEGITKISKQDLTLARHYANLRNKLIHERATVNIPDDDIANYKAVCDRIIQRLFGVSLD